MKLYLSSRSRYEVKIQKLCSSAIYKQNVLISLCFGDPVQCRRGLYFRAWVLYLRFGT